MRAITFSEYGPASNLRLSEVPMPQPGPEDVLIRVAAAGINPADCNLRAGRFRLFLRLQLPFVPGSDVAGVVEAVGESVSQFQPGDRVFAMTPTKAGGGYAEYAVAPVSSVAIVPDALGMEEAGGIPLAGLTAKQGLDKAGPLNGRSVLVYGASGGVGSLAVQIATARGARVTAVTSARNTDLVAGLGADDVVDYESAAWTADPGEYDVVLDAAAVLSLREGLRRTARGGAFISLNPGYGNPLFKLVGRLSGRRVASLVVKPGRDDLQHLADLLASGTVRPLIDRVYPLEAAEDAHRYSESRRARGKIVLAVS